MTTGQQRHFLALALSARIFCHSMYPKYKTSQIVVSTPPSPVFPSLALFSSCAGLPLIILQGAVQPPPHFLFYWATKAAHPLLRTWPLRLHTNTEDFPLENWYLTNKVHGKWE